MKMIPEIDLAKCQICQPCLASQVCAIRAIIQIDRDEPAFIEPARCNGCSKCIPECPSGAIKLPGTFHYGMN